MVHEEEKGFKVIDRRVSASEGKKDETVTETNSENECQCHEKKGEGFVMKDSSEESTKSPVLDKIDFSTLVLSFATQAMMDLGMSPNPHTHKTEKNLALAQQNIDILCLLKDKTKGNLAKEEDELLCHLLTQLRLSYVEASTKS